METTLVDVRTSNYDIYIGRGKCPNTGIESIWGNPFSHKQGTLAKFKVKNRKEAIISHMNWIHEPEQKWLLDKIMELDGKILGCWCIPLGCHGHNLIKIIKENKQKIKF
jgi:hypothetical protein